MTRIVDLLAQSRTFSFEFFPPKSEDGDQQLRQALAELKPLGPSFVSVTYGAGGSTRERTHAIVVDILDNLEMLPMAHLTCVGHTRAELVDIVERYRDAGIENVLALRGDPPREGPPPPPGDLHSAAELVELVRGVGPMSVGVAAHPEAHPDSPDRETDLDHLAHKLELADFAITQLFFAASDYVDMIEGLERRGMTKPILPGIMPVTNVKQIQRMAQLSGAAFPADLAIRLLAVEDDPEEVRRIGVEVATELCEKLLAEGAPGLHFYTLNRSTATREIYANLGLPGNA